jgi:hypothetical protein
VTSDPKAPTKGQHVTKSQRSFRSRFYECPDADREHPANRWTRPRRAERVMERLESLALNLGNRFLHNMSFAMLSP